MAGAVDLLLLWYDLEGRLVDLLLLWYDLGGSARPKSEHWFCGLTDTTVRFGEVAKDDQ